MYLLGLGVVLLLLKYLAFGVVAEWSWWAVLAPFALAVLWWVWADQSGYTKRKAVEKMEQKKRDRVEKQRDALGLNKGRRR